MRHVTSIDRLSGASIDAGAATRGEFRIVDIIAPGSVVLFFVLQFEVLLNVVNPPGMVRWAVLPAVCLGTLAVTPWERLRTAAISLPLVAALLWLAATYLWSAAPAHTLFLVRSQLMPTILIGLVAATIEPHRLTRVLVSGFTAIVLFSLGISLVVPDARRVVYVEGLVGPQEGFRGMFQHKNLLGIMGVLALAIQLPHLRHPWRRPLIAMTLATLLLTRSATAGSGMFVVLFIWCWLVIVRRQRSARGRSVVAVVAISSVVVAVLLALRLLPALLGVYQKDITFSGRTDIWAATLWVAGERPWTGHGLGALFSPDPPALTYEVWRRIGFDAAHAHNGPLALLVDAGAIGVALVVVLLAVMIRQAIRLLGVSESAAIGQWSLMTIGSVLFMSISEPLLAGPNLAWLGVIAVVTQRVVVDQRSRALPTNPPAVLDRT